MMVWWGRYLRVVMAIIVWVEWWLGFVIVVMLGQVMSCGGGSGSAGVVLSSTLLTCGSDSGQLLVVMAGCYLIRCALTVMVVVLSAVRGTHARARACGVIESLALLCGWLCWPPPSSCRLWWGECAMVLANCCHCCCHAVVVLAGCQTLVGVVNGLLTSVYLLI